MSSLTTFFRKGLLFTDEVFQKLTKNVLLRGRFDFLEIGLIEKSLTEVFGIDVVVRPTYCIQFRIGPRAPSWIKAFCKTDGEHRSESQNILDMCFFFFKKIRETFDKPAARRGLAIARVVCSLRSSSDQPGK